MGDFEKAWAVAEPVRGWLTRDQGRDLWSAAHDVPPGGRMVEIGSHQGRSTVVLGAAARDVGATVVAIDPFLAGGMFGGSATRSRFEANIDAAGLSEVVGLIPEKSTHLRPRWREPVAMLFIDGKHDYWTVRDDLRWTEHVIDGGVVLIHDAFSSVGVTLALLAHVLPGRRLRYTGRTGSLARFVVERPARADRWRMLRELPWFCRNFLIKVGLRLARLVGYRGTPDPY